ncbi:MAG: hypothetical protein IPH12_11820 [Saprospirales bacterium]|nr:hypothetical protein [Saprospirales bacterium]
MNIPSGFFVLSWLFACLLTGGLPGRCAGQTGGNSVSFTHLTPDDGLSGARVRSFCHDSKGFIWIGAEGGLNRFDGYKCAVYEPVPGGKGSLGGNMVPALLEDSRGNFWVGTNEGLQLMDRVAGLFFPPAGADQNPLNAIGHVLTLKEDRDGTVWAGTTAGLFRLLCGATTAFSRENFHRQVAKGELRLVRFSHNDQDARSLSHNHVWSIETDRAGCLWLGTGRGLNRLDPKTNTIERFPFPDIPGAGALATATVNTLLFDRAGYFWIGTANGLYRIAPGEKTMRVFRAAPNRPDGLSNDFVTHIVEDGQGRLWVGSDGGGLDLWNPGTGAFIRHQHDPDDPKSLNDNNIEALYADRDGGLWVGHHKGLSYRSRYQKPFQVYRNTGGKATLSPGGILCLFVGADGTVWTGIDDGGMDALDQETGAVAHFQRLPGNAQSIGDDDVVAIFEDSRGTVWIGTWGGGLSRFIPRLPKGRTSGVFLHNSPDGKPGSIGDNDIVHFYEDKKGALWLGTVDDGLNAFDPAANTFRSFRWPVRDPGNLFKNWVFDIAEDRKGDLWVANIEGLGRLNRSAGAIENFPLSRKSQRSRIYCLHPHPDGGFWLGADDGLFLFDPEKKSLRHWRRQDGLADNAVTCILEDARGNLWLGAPKGISRLNVRTGDIRVYDARDGLLGGAYTAGAIDRRSGELLFAGANGINVFHPDSIRENPQPPPVVITGFRLFNRPVPVSGSPGDTLDFASPLQREIFYSEAIRLPHWQNDFSFEFAALNYLNPEKNRYKYRLEGYRDNWIETEAGENSAHYTNLSPGTYTFTVIGSNNDGVWNQTGATVRIVIARPWWGAWWAYLLYLLALGGVLYWLIRKELKEQQLRLSLELERVETEQLKEIDKTKSRLYANITHEFRTPLTVILGMVEQVEKNPRPGLARVWRLSAATARICWG